MPVEMQGLDELREALRQLPEELTSEAAGIVHYHAERAMQDIGTSYPEDTGNLRRGLFLRTIGTATSARGHAGFGALVVNKAKHAYIYEHGSEQRYTDSGARRGKMPPGRIFIPIAMRQRRLMTNALVALVRRAGFTVNGAEGA